MVGLGGNKKASGVAGADRHPAGGEGPSFGDIVGQDELKRGLLAVGANDDLGGLLIQGEKGTAKSTAVRALSGLLETQRVVADCPYGCPPDEPADQCRDCRSRSDPPTAERSVPLVTVPLGATREQVVGTLSVADALAGEFEFDPGLLARANRGILYVDEVNLLADHLVDVLLDAAAGGTNTVERDGVSVTHPASFTLVGTMNPEEGDLRPQLRDRFALQVSVSACADLDQRAEIVDRAVGTGRESVAEDHPRERFREARARLDDVDLPAEHVRAVARLCREAGVDGHRGDIATARAARTFAALDRRETVLEADVHEAAEYALPHRLRSTPFEDTPDPDDLIEEGLDDAASADQEGEDDSTEPDAGNDGDDSSPESEPDEDNPDDEPSPDEEGTPDGTETDGSSPAEGTDGGQQGTTDPGGEGNEETRESRAGGGAEEEPGDVGAGEQGAQGQADDDADEATPLLPGQSASGDVGTADAPSVTLSEATESGGDQHGRVAQGPSPDGDGARVRTRRADQSDTVDAAASVRAAAARGSSAVESRDLRQSVRATEGAALVLFVVDASASMQRAMRAAKGTVLELLKDAYQERDEVGFVAFAGDGAEVLLPPTDSVTLAARHLKELPTGDRTPLPAGLRTARTVLDEADPTASVVVLVTDGRANVADGSPVAATRTAARDLAETDCDVLVVDAGEDTGSTLVGPIVDETDGRRVPLAALSADHVDATVGAARDPDR